MLSLANITAKEKTFSELTEYVRKNRLILEEVASFFNIQFRDLELQVLLHLPRIVRNGEFPQIVEFKEDVYRLGSFIRCRIKDFISLKKYPTAVPDSPRSTKFVQIPEEEAKIILERFHYILSFRFNSLHYGLKTTQDNRLVALVTLSPFDLNHVSTNLPIKIDPTDIMVISRVYSFDWAPTNTISYLLGQIDKLIVKDFPLVKALTTYVNPNLGFNGSSYKASNWTYLGSETNTKYRYLDAMYITDRELDRRFGCHNSDSLFEILGNRIESTHVELSPLLLFARYYNKEFEKACKNCELIFWKP